VKYIPTLAVAYLTAALRSANCDIKPTCYRALRHSVASMISFLRPFRLTAIRSPTELKVPLAPDCHSRYGLWRECPVQATQQSETGSGGCGTS